MIERMWASAELSFPYLSLSLFHFMYEKSQRERGRMRNSKEARKKRSDSKEEKIGNFISLICFRCRRHHIHTLFSFFILNIARIGTPKNWVRVSTRHTKKRKISADGRTKILKESAKATTAHTEKGLKILRKMLSFTLSWIICRWRSDMKGKEMKWTER